MARRLFSVALLAMTVVVPGLAVAQTPEPTSAVMVVKVDGSIDRTVDGYLRDALADAEADGAAVVIQL
ncbi:MAG TPA: hypothetical protein VEC09_06540, partial [Actinomycetota bacterium]|nr:hypothetical protein [Actinomycetota bacterium]